MIGTRPIQCALLDERFSAATASVKRIVHFCYDTIDNDLETAVFCGRLAELIDCFDQARLNR